MLARNAQRRAVFHQANVVDVGHLGASHALVNPAHHIAQDALHVVVQLLLFFAGAPIGFCDHGHLQQVIQNLVAHFVEVDFF